MAARRSGVDGDLTGLRRAVEAEPGDATAWLRLAQAHARAGATGSALEAARRALALDPALDDARALARRAYVELTAEVEPPGLREAIGRALGRDGPWTEPAGWDDAHLLGGSVHAASGTVAWVEDLQREPPGSPYVDCQVALHVARGGRELLVWPLAHYNPFFGTTLLHVATDGERVVLVYHEKHLTLVAVVPLVGPPAIVEASEPLLVLADQVVFAAEERGVLPVRVLPDLRQGSPLVGPALVSRFEKTIRLDGDRVTVVAGAEAATFALPPGPPAPALSFLEARRSALGGVLAGAPQPHADALLGAVAHSFWIDSRQVSTGYAGGRRPWSSPYWLPVYWHRQLIEAGRRAEAAAVLGMLEEVAARHAADGDGPPERLASHLIARSAELRDAIRAGHRLPRGARCWMWEDGAVEALLGWLDRFPPGFVQVFSELRAARPRPLERYDDPASSR